MMFISENMNNRNISLSLYIVIGRGGGRGGVCLLMESFHKNIHTLMWLRKYRFRYLICWKTVRFKTHLFPDLLPHIVSKLVLDELCHVLQQ